MESFFFFFFSFVFSRSNRYRPSRYWRSRQGNRKSDSLLAFSIAYAKLNGLAESGPRGQHTRLRKDRARRRSMPTNAFRNSNSREFYFYLFVLTFDHLRCNVEMRNLEHVRVYIMFIFEEKEICSNVSIKYFASVFWIFGNYNEIFHHVRNVKILPDNVWWKAARRLRVEVKMELKKI